MHHGRSETRWLAPDIITASPCHSLIQPCSPRFQLFGSSSQQHGCRETRRARKTNVSSRWFLARATLSNALASHSSGSLQGYGWDLALAIWRMKSLAPVLIAVRCHVSATPTADTPPLPHSEGTTLSQGARHDPLHFRPSRVLSSRCDRAAHSETDNLCSLLDGTSALGSKPLLTSHDLPGLRRPHFLVFFGAISAAMAMRSHRQFCRPHDGGKHWQHLHRSVVTTSIGAVQTYLNTWSITVARHPQLRLSNGQSIRLRCTSSLPALAASAATSSAKIDKIVGLGAQRRRLLLSGNFTTLFEALELPSDEMQGKRVVEVTGV